MKFFKAYFMINKVGR